ncbi:A-kinase anchor protein 9-like [Notamacropus eugenii]|uniref:A-kinase anchor protein 9-like n=1 Tax=Notamacropus eugenii TaxID=9315 RepID=UPI003B675B23
MGEVVAGPFSMLLIILPFSVGPQWFARSISPWSTRADLPFGRTPSPPPSAPGKAGVGGRGEGPARGGGPGGGAWNAAGGSGGGALGAPARTLVHGDCANVLLPLLPPSASVFPWRRGWRLRRTRSSREPAWRVGAGPVAEHCGAQSRPTETSVSIRPFPSLSLPPCPSSFPAQAMEDEERQKKLIRGKALLAQYQLKKARAEAQNSSKQQKGKKKPSAKKCEESSHTSSIDQSQSDELYMTSSQRGASVTPDITRTLHTGEIIKHDQSYTIEMESEISTTTDDYSSEVNGCSLVQADIPTNLLMEEEFGVGESYSEQGAQFPSKRLEMMENELAGKQQEIEELNRELEEMRAAYGTEGFQQLQEFEAAIKQRDGIITQLTATLQQARREKDETMREFLEVTEQSQKLQIQFHHLQASQSLRNTNHSSTAADLLQAKHQIVWQQQQLEQQHRLLEDHQKKKEEFKMQINFLQEKIGTYEMEMKEQKDSSKKELEEKDSVMEELKIKLVEEEENSVELKDKLIATDKLLGDFKEQIVEKEKEISNIRLELANSEQKERQRSGEIKQLMGTVEELQKKSRKESQLETETVQRMEIQTQQKLEKLRVELDEMYGQQIVQMKQELIKQHMFELDELNAQHKGQLENALKTCRDIPVNENQIQLMNMAITELNLKLQDAISQKEKISKELEIISRAKSILQSQLEDLFEELSFSREQVQRARQTIAEQEDELNEAHKLLSGVEDLKAQIVSASEFRKDLELKHEAEVSNYKIKLEMLEKEKNAIFDRMADSQEAELERLRTQLLFSHEEELTRLREGLEIEHEMNIEKLKDNLSVHDKQQIEELQKEMSHEMESIQFEKDNLITKQNQLFLEISKLKDLQQSLVNSKSEEMTLQIKELQKEIEVLRQEEKEKGTLEQEVQELQLKTEFLERQIKEKGDDLQEKFTQLETEHTILENEKKTLEDMLKMYSPISKEEGFIFIDSVKPKSEECEWQKKIDIVLEENEKLTKQCTQLNEEIERQRNTYSFAEKNFETNYQELREEYAYLLKITNLEEQLEQFREELENKNEELQQLHMQLEIEKKERRAHLEDLEQEKRFLQDETERLGFAVQEFEDSSTKDHHQVFGKFTQMIQEKKLEIGRQNDHITDLQKQLEVTADKKVVSVPGSIHSDFYQSREMCSSDSGLDWSQGIGLQQSQEFDIEDTPREERENSLTPEMLKGLLREVHDEGVQVLALTEPHFSEGDACFTEQTSAFCLEDREIYLNVISSDVDLIAKMQVQRETELNESSQSHENPPDWQSEFLHAFQQIYLEVQNILLAIRKTDLTALPMRDVHGLVNLLEQRLQDQVIKCRAAMEYIQSADRRSLLSEIQPLWAQINTEKMTMKREEESDSQSQELLEHNMQQKQAQILEMQVELSALKEKAAKLQEELSSERVRAADLQDEQTQARLELETTLKAQHKHLKELEAFRMEAKEKTEKVHLLNDTLANEQKETRELQWALEKEKAKLERSEEREREELEDLKYSLEGQKQRNVQLNQLLE